MLPNLKTVLHAALDRFQLERDGIHGVAHWGRVRANGLRLAKVTGARVGVVEAFSFLHDSCREDDNDDPEHGARAAEFARQLVASNVLLLDARDLELLTIACRWHSYGTVLDDVTVCTCWDADRLDLGRIGIRPDPARLCTEAAMSPDMLEWAYKRSLGGKVGRGEPM
jgi:uncharacterized protein